MNTTILSASARPKLSPRAKLETDRVTGKPIVLHPDGVMVLNRPGFVTASLCNGTLTVSQILSSVARQFSSSPDQVEPEVERLLCRLHSRRLIDLNLSDSRTSSLSA